MSDRDYLALPIVVLFGVLLAFGISAVLDELVLQDNLRQGLRVDEAGNQILDEIFLERIRVQAIEVHILGTGTAMMITMAILVLWLERRLKP